jgi:hypothetical protein
LTIIPIYNLKKWAFSRIGIMILFGAFLNLVAKLQIRRNNIEKRKY